MKARFILTKIATVAIFVPVFGCTQLKQLGQMHDNTQDMDSRMTGMSSDTHAMNGQMKGMAGDTHQMNGQMAGMADDTHQMNNQMSGMANDTRQMGVQMSGLSKLTAAMGVTTSDLYDAAKQGTSLQLREQLLKELAKADNEVVKISKAAKYLMSFEYQIWTGTSSETLDSRNQLAAMAAQEFMAEVQAFAYPGETLSNPGANPIVSKQFRKTIPAGGDTTVPDELDQDSNLNAITAMLQITNRTQDNVFKQGVVKNEISMYSMINESILAKSDIESGKKKISDFPPYVAEVLKFEDVAVLLLQSRHNVLSMLALAQLSQLGQSDNPLNLVQKMVQGSWTLNTDQMNSAEVGNAVTFMDSALETRKLLSRAGITPNIDQSVQAMWQNAKLTDELEAVKSKKTPANARTAALSTFLVDLAPIIDADQAPAPIAAAK